MRRKIINVAIALAALTILFITCDGPWHVRNMFVFQRKARQTEAKINLSTIATAQNSYFEKTKEWGSLFETLSWAPDGNPRYVYFLTPSEHAGRPLAELGLTLPVDFSIYDAPAPGIHPTQGFTAVAIGNVDDDETLDVWYINQAGNPTYTLNDANK